MHSRTIQYIARFLSIVGHPLLTISLLVYYLSHKELSPKEAGIVSAIIFGGVSLPIIVHNLWKTHSGQYTNFDVSNQHQRRRFFLFVISLLVVVTVYFWLKEMPNGLVRSTECFLSMIVLFAFINSILKASMHAGINFYITALLFHYNMRVALILLVFSIAVSLSRWILRRHTFAEILIGSCIGFVFGLINIRLL